MNVNMKWIQRAAMLALATGVVGTAVVAKPMQQSSGKDDQAASATMARLADQISIMRVLITKSINEGQFAERYAEAQEQAREQAREALAEKLKEQRAAETADENMLLAYKELAESRYSYGFMNGSSTFTSHTRGFYASGVGVLFSTEVRVPLRQVEVEPGDEPENAESSDEWAEAAVEARSGGAYQRAIEAELRASRAASSGPVTRWEINPTYIEDAIAGVTEKIASYGMRVTELPDDESFIVAIRFEPDHSTAHWPTVINLSNAFGQPMVYNWSSGIGRSARTAATVHVVVEVPMELVRRHESGAISLEQVRQSATVTTLAYGRESVSSMWREG